MRQRKFGSGLNLQAQVPSSGLLGPRGHRTASRSEAFRGQPPQAALGPRSRHTPRRPCGLSYGIGATGRMLFWIPDQNNARRFSGFQPGLRAAASVSRTTAAGGSWAEIAFHATLGQDAPCGLGVSGPSPQAPPRWGKVRFLSVLIFHCRWMRLLARRSAYIGQPVQSGSSQAGAKNCAGEGRCSRCLTRRLSI